MLGVDKGAGTALFLRLGNHVQRERRLARAFRPIDFDDATLGQAADAQRDIEAQRAGRDRLDLQRLALAQLHDGTLAEGALDLGESGVQRLVLAFQAFFFDHLEHRRHWLSPSSHAPVRSSNADKSAAGLVIQ